MSGRIVIVGAGPAGLAAGHELARHGVQSVIVDQNDRVGGLARTIWRDGYGFDLGPHRFFTKNREVLDLWREYLGPDLLEVDRLTRIYYRGRFFAYPLRPLDALAKLGPVTTAKAIGSYARERLRRHPREPENFEDWIVAQFGRVLFDVFFRSYTEKVWGIPCDTIGKEWAGQRIKGLNLTQAIAHAFRRSDSRKVRSLVERFHYPRLGAGQLYDRMAERLVEGRSEVRTGVTATRLETEGSRIVRLHCDDGSSIEVDHLFASAPITSVAKSLDPAPPSHVLDAAQALYYRSHVTVNLVVDGEPPFPDNWIYIQSRDFRMARVSNYASFSRDLVGRPGTTGLSVEYFCFETDDLWTMGEEELIALASREMDGSGLLDASRITGGFVVKEKESYPTYYLGHREQFDVLFGHLSRFENLTLVGRAGMYRYNNQDHASLTGLYAARNHLGLSDTDLFSINPEDEYIEETRPAEVDR